MIYTLWRRLFPPGGDIAVAREPSGFTLDIPSNPPKVERGWRGILPPGATWGELDTPERFIAGERPLPVRRLGLWPKPQRKIDGLLPSPADLNPDGWCWAWNPNCQHWALVPAEYVEPTTPWLPYWAIANPDTP